MAFENVEGEASVPDGLLDSLLRGLGVADRFGGLVFDFGRLLEQPTAQCGTL